MFTQMQKLKKDITLEEVRDVLRDLETVSTDLIVNPREIQDINLGTMVVPELGEVPLTNDASCQLAEKAGIPTSVFRWLRKNEPQKCQEIFDTQWASYLANASTDSRLLVRARDWGGLRVRAVLSDRYGIIDSKDVIEALCRLLPDQTNQPLSGMKSEFWLDSLTGAISFKGILGFVRADWAKDREQHSWGVTGGNDECGRGSSHFDLLYSRLFCTNQFAGLNMGKTRQSHVIGKEGISKFEGRVREWMVDRFKSPESPLVKYWGLKDKILNPELAGERLVSVGRQVGLPKADLELVAANVLPQYVEEVGCNAYAVVNSLTSFAKDIEDRTKQALWESAAGRVVTLMG